MSSHELEQGWRIAIRHVRTRMTTFTHDRKKGIAFTHVRTRVTPFTHQSKDDSLHTFQNWGDSLHVSEQGW